jgi:hypothetical protein
MSATKPNPNPQSRLTPFGNAVGGAFSGMFAVAVSYPFDLIKTRIHFEVGKMENIKTASTPKLSILSVGRTIVKEGGVISLYRGLDQLAPEAAFKTMLRFVAFKRLQLAYLEFSGEKNVSVVGNLLCGAVSGALETTLVVQPFERGKTLRADFKNPYQIWGQAFRDSGATGSIRSIYTGYIPTLGRQVGNQATAFTAFYSGKTHFLKYTGQDELSSLQRVFGGFVAGCCAATVTMPLDVAKSIAQKQTNGVKVGMVSIMRGVVLQRGLLGLYAGLSSRLLRVGIDRACGFWAFDTLAEFMTEIPYFLKK